MTNRFTVPPPFDRGIPPLLIDGLERYFNEHIRTGGFLEAVLSNDLHLAVKRADPLSYRALPEIIDLLLAEAPACAWGSRKAVDAWIGEGGADDRSVRREAEGEQR